MVGIDITSTQNQYKDRGIGVFAKNIIQSFINDIPGEIVLFGFDGITTLEKLEGIKFQSINKGILNSNPITNIYVSYVLSKAIAKYNLVNSIQPIDSFFSPFIHSGISYNSGVEVYPFVHDVIQKVTNVYSDKNFFINYIRSLQYNFDWSRLKGASKIITNSNTSKYFINKYFKYTNIEIDYLGVDHKLYNPSVVLDRNILQKYNLGDNYILYFGGDEKNKNVGFVINSFIKYVNEYSDKSLKLVILGNGFNFQRNYIDKHIKSFTDRIIFTGFVDDNEKISIMKGTKCYVNFSKIEGFGMSVLENMAMGVPCIISSNDVYKELFEGCALFVELEDSKTLSYNGAAAINEILTNRDMRELLMSRSLERAKSFTWENTYKKILNIILKN